MPRLRFSLRAFLLLLFIVSLLGSNFFTAWQLRQLREENAGMRKELGRLVVSDPDKINVVAVPTYEDMLWRWRVYVPKGKSLRLYESVNTIPETGFPANYGSSGLAEGEYLLTAAIRRDRKGQWQFTVAGPQSSSSFGIADDQAAWLVESPGWSSEQAGSGATEVFNAGEPIVLLRLRSMEKQAGGVSTTTPKPSEGVMIWIGKQ
jgi:hypothetical protein